MADSVFSPQTLQWPSQNLEKSANMASNLKLTSSSELMSNYKQIEVLDQSKEFVAVQTSSGHSLFFGIGTDGHLHLIVEKKETRTGWKKIELSNVLPGTVKSFDVAQDDATGHIDIALAMADTQGADTLYLMMDNSDSDLAWTEKIAWKKIGDDRRNPENPKLVIDRIYLTESSAGAEYAVVETTGARGFAARYWINSKAGADQAWNEHALPVNLDATAGLSSLLGRKSGDMVDGIYTLGAINQLPQLIYQPLYNPFDLESAPSPTNFDLTGTRLTTTNAAFSICNAASGSANATDMFIAGGGTLYYLAADKQSQLARPVVACGNPLFQNVRELYAERTATKIVIWGLNNADQIFYTSCNPAEINNPAAWSVPLPIATGVSEVSPYVHRKNQGLTIFMETGEDGLLKGLQDPETSRWKFVKIELPTEQNDAKATKALSYTTTVHVTDQNNNPVPGVDVTVTAGSRTSVYINHLYYALDVNPVTMKTDANGTLTIIEWVTGLQATEFRFDAGDGGNAVPVNPMAGPLNKIGSLASEQQLDSARITNHDGSTRPLLPSTVSGDDKKALLASLNNLHSAYQGLSANKASAPRSVTAMAAAPVKRSVLDYIEVSAGDVFEWLKKAGKYVISFVKEAGAEVWHFIVTIGKEVYGFIIDTVDKIAGALETVWNKIVKGVEDLVDFLKFLFEWQDMVRTKNVMKQIVKIFFHRMGEDLQKARKSMDSSIDGAEKVIKDWAKIPETSRPSLGSADHSLNATLKKNGDTSQGQSAPSKMLQSHFSGNVHNSTTTLSPPSVAANPTWSGLTDLSDFVEQEKSSINDLVGQIKQLLAPSGKASDPSLSEILKRIAGDIAIMGMELFKMVADKILDLLTLLIDEMIKALDAPIYIPIVTDILEDLFGITMPSILDVICLIGAVPATIVYKALRGTAPYPGGSGSLDQKILSAKTYAELQAAFGSTGDQVTLSQDARNVIYETGHIVSGIATMVRGVLVVLDEETDGAAKTVLQTPKTITSVIASLTQVIGDLFVMPAPLKNPTMVTYASVVTKVNIFQTVAFLVAPSAIAKIKGVTEEGAVTKLGKQVGVVSDFITALVSLVGLVPPCYHIYEIAENSPDDAALGIMESTQDITGKLSKITGFAALVDEEEISKQVLVVIQGLLILITGGVQIAEAAVEAA